MSGEPSKDEPKPAAAEDSSAADGGVIPVEVEPPDAPEQAAQAAKAEAAADAPAEAAAAVDKPASDKPDVAAAADKPAADKPAETAPEPAPDPMAALHAKISALEKEKKDNWDKYLRAAADVENLRKRQRRELDDARFDTKNKVLKEMLPVVDNLERAIEHAGGGGGEVDAALKPIVEGVQLVLRQFTTAFERLEVHPIDAMGQPFDPNIHEAISQQESDQPPGTVVQVLQRGYRAGDRLLRPSLVVVAKAKA